MRKIFAIMALAALAAFSMPSPQAQAATVTLTPAELVGLTITFPVAGVYPLDVVVSGPGGSTSAVLTVTVNDAVAPPTLTVKDATGLVGESIPLSILTDAELITITIPDDATLSSGMPSPSDGVTLIDSGPVSASANGEVIENLRITADCETGIVVDGFLDVTIRNVEIHHSCSHGIHGSHAHGLTIQNVRIVRTDVPLAGVAPSQGNNIHIVSSNDVTVTRAQLWRGSSGIYALHSYGARLRFIEGHDFRGPMPRGQLVQFNKSLDCLLENFSAENPLSTSWTEDNVSVYQSPGCTIRRGFLDGNNSPAGVGVIFELQQSGGSGLVEDVDTIRQGNGSFSVHNGEGVIFRRTRVRDNSCEDEGRGVPLSGGTSWHSYAGATGTRIEDSRYWNLCGSLVYDHSTVVVEELVEEDFALNPPLRLSFSWD